jgi:hypothetical protein
MVALRCPGADAPGFMLSPASQAKTFVMPTFCAKPPERDHSMPFGGIFDGPPY